MHQNEWENYFHNSLQHLWPKARSAMIFNLQISDESRITSSGIVYANKRDVFNFCEKNFGQTTLVRNAKIPSDLTFTVTNKSICGNSILKFHIIYQWLVQYLLTIPKRFVMFKLALGSLVAAAIGIHSVGFLTKPTRIYLFHELHLKNCDLDNIVAVANLTTGDIRSFRFGEAFIRAKKSDWLKIVINEDFQDIYFDGEKIKAGKQVKIVQNCLSETTLDSILIVLTKHSQAKWFLDIVLFFINCGACYCTLSVYNQAYFQ